MNRLLLTALLIACIAAFLLLPAKPAYAAQTGCEAEFSMSGSDERGLFFGTMQQFQGIDDRTIISRLGAIAQADGFQVDSEEATSDGASLAFSQRASKSARGFMLDAKSKGGTVAFTVAMPPGMKANPDEIRTNMCRMLARVESGNASEARSADQTSDAARTAAPQDPAALKVLRPKAIFDPVQARQALEPGDAAITGTACSARQGTMMLASNSPVYLYPVTPYMEEAIALLGKLHSGRADVELSRMAMATRMTAQTNGSGQFQFLKMKPGRYYLLATMSSTFRNVRDVKAGTAYGLGVSVDIYRSEEYDQSYNDMLEKVVEISRPGQTVNVTLTPKRSLNIFRKTGHPGIFGCHQVP